MACPNPLCLTPSPDADLLDAAMQLIACLEQATPVKVLGMRADFSLLSSIVGLVGSAFAFGAQELLNTGDR